MVSSSKLNKYMVLTIILYIVLCGIIIIFSFKYVEGKRDRLRSEAYSELRNFFKEQDKFVMIEYSGEKVSYEKGEVPQYSQSSLFSFIYSEREKAREKAEWEERYGNVYKIYNLKPKWESTNSYDTDNKWTGWLFNIIESTGMGFQEYQIFPRSVGYFKQESRWLYDYAPSVQTAIDEAFEFHTTNPKSSYYGKISEIHPWDIISKVENEYYQMFSYDYLKSWRGKEYADSLLTWSPWSLADDGCMQYSKAEEQIRDDGGAMYNRYYRVDNKYVPIAFWNIVYDVWSDPQTKDRNRIFLYGLTSPTILFVLLMILLINKRSQLIRFEKETIKQRLLRMCHPNNFMTPFDKEKIDKANVLYSKVLEVLDDDRESLKALVDDAMRELSISFIDDNALNKLKKQCNPSDFMNPYNAEKVTLATELFSILNKENLTYSEYCSVEDRLKLL